MGELAQLKLAGHLTHLVTLQRLYSHYMYGAAGLLCIGMFITRRGIVECNGVPGQQSCHTRTRMVFARSLHQQTSCETPW